MPETPIKLVREWCQSLGVLAAVAISRSEAEMRMAAYVPLLRDRFPAAAFTTASLEHCAAAARKGFPTYAELVTTLGDWWRENVPRAVVALPAPPQLADWQKRERERAEIAGSWDDPAAVLACLRACGGKPLLIRTLRAAVNRWAPHHLDLLLESPPADEPCANAQPQGANAQPLPEWRPSVVPPHVLDVINPLPNGRKRHAADLGPEAHTTHTTRASAAPVDADPAA